MNVAQEIVGWMIGKGIRRVFGIPGGGASLDLINAAEQEGIEYVLMSHEGSASTAAAVFGDLEGTVGVCSTIMGPGAMNAVFGAGLACLENLPLIVFTDRYPDSVWDKISHQRICHHELFTAVVKHSGTVEVGNVYGVLDAAYEHVFRGRPGAAHIDLANDLLNRASDSPKPSARPTGTTFPSEADIQAAVVQIDRAARPVLLVGAGAKNPLLRRSLTAFVDKLGIPFLPSYRAKGLISEDHPLYAGAMFGLSNEGSFEHCVLSQADLLIQVGTRRSETPRVWGFDTASVLIDDVDPGGESVAPAGVRLIGDLGDLINNVGQQVSQRECWDRRQIQSLWERLLSKVEMSDQALTTEGVITIARELLPKESYVCSETGVFNMMLGHLWRSYRPNTFLTPSATTTMGFSIPAVLAASLHDPAHHALAFCGDGSFHMRAGELETLGRIGARVVLVVFHDGGLGTIKIPYRAKSYACGGLDFGDVDIAKIAGGYNLRGVRVYDHAGYRDALGEALRHDGPTLIEVMIGARDYDRFVDEIRSNMTLGH